MSELGEGQKPGSYTGADGREYRWGKSNSGYYHTRADGPWITKQEATWSWRFAWHFHGEGDLRSALEEYTAFLEAPGVGKYGDRLLGGDESDGATYTCKMRIRAEIDACIEALQYPWFRRLLDLYYRRGLSCENRGWCIVAKRLGLRGDPGSKWDRDTFEVQLSLAISRLWRVHDDRYQRKS